MNPDLSRPLPARPRIIFMGTPDFAVPALKSLAAHGHHVQGVVTQPDRPRGRSGKPVPSPVKKAAEQLGLAVFQPQRASDASFCRRMEAISPDLLVVIAFGQILSEALLNIPSWGGLNIHASLLPKYRGAAPIQRAIMDDETETGLTAMHMTRGLDCGPILTQEKMFIGAHETAGQLHDRLAEMAAPFLLGTLRDLSENRILERVQNEGRATYAAKIDRTTGRIFWDRSARQISATIRAMDPWPGAYTSIDGKTLKLFSSRVMTAEGFETVPGRIKGHSKEGLLVETKDGIIRVAELQLAGRKRLSVWDFLRGYPLESGIILGKAA